jgi:protein-tyrosine phosphatase
MIDLHCHLLPGIDDGAPDATTALAMARLAVADGIATIACTPHVYPGLYDNEAGDIRRRVASLQSQLDAAGVPLRLVAGADAHLTPDLTDRLAGDRVPTLHGSRYFLLEPPHHVAPPRFEDTVRAMLRRGFVPLITHPERLQWIEGRHAVFERLALAGAWLQLTAGSLTGRFGRRARYWAERLLDRGLVHVLATDAHGARDRPPLLAEASQRAARWVGTEEADRLVRGRPQAVLDDRCVEDVVPIPASRGQRDRSRHRALVAG